MLKKYGKLTLLFITPILGTSLYRMMQLPEQWARTSSSTSRFGNITYPDTPYFSNFSLAILFLYVAATLPSLTVFYELRSRDTGSFIASLPVKRSAVFTSAFFSGFLLITLSFIPMTAFLLHRVSQMAPELRAIFVVYERLDWAEELIMDTRQVLIADAVRNYAVLLCLYGILTFVQTLFQKPLGAICALVGAMGGFVLCVMTCDKYLTVLGQADGINAWFSGAGRLRYFRYFNQYFSENDTLSVFRFLLLFFAVTAVAFVLGLFLYQKGSRHADFIFTYPAAKKIMHAGITLCTGCLAVYGLYTAVGINGLRLGTMNLFFAVGALSAYFLIKKIYSVLC